MAAWGIKWHNIGNWAYCPSNHGNKIYQLVQPYQVVIGCATWLVNYINVWCNYCLFVSKTAAVGKRDENENAHGVTTGKKLLYTWLKCYYINQCRVLISIRFFSSPEEKFWGKI